jgi:cell division protein FtsL
MTIIKPSEYASYIRFFALILGILLFGGVVYIFQYNSLVDTRFEIRSLKEKIVELEASNADLKNAIYEATEPEKLRLFAVNSNLILEKNPEFLSSDKWLSDSSL